jgi:hypothetical protein
MLLIFCTKAVLTTLHFLRYLQMGLISQSGFPWQSFTAKCNVTLQLIRPICELRRKLRINAADDFSTFTFYSNTV